MLLILETMHTGHVYVKGAIQDREKESSLLLLDMWNWAMRKNKIIITNDLEISKKEPILNCEPDLSAYTELKRSKDITEKSLYIFTEGQSEERRSSG